MDAEEPKEKKEKKPKEKKADEDAKPKKDTKKEKTEKGDGKEKTKDVEGGGEEEEKKKKKKTKEPKEQDDQQKEETGKRPAKPAPSDKKPSPPPPPPDDEKPAKGSLPPDETKKKPAKLGAPDGSKPGAPPADAKKPSKPGPPPDVAKKPAKPGGAPPADAKNPKPGAPAKPSKPGPPAEADKPPKPDAKTKPKRPLPQLPEAISETGLNYSTPPPQPHVTDKMNDDALIEAILVERRKRVYWEKEAHKKKRELNIAKHRSEKIKAYTKSVNAKIKELETEEKVFDVEEQVFEKGFTAQLEGQEDEFCSKILELERHMDNNEVTWHIQSSELRDEDVIATNEHLQKEDELHLEIEELKRKIHEDLEKMKGLKQAYVKGDKIVQIQEMKLTDLKTQYKSQKGIPGSRPSPSGLGTGTVLGLGGATVAASSQVTPKHKPSARTAPYIPMMTPQSAQETDLNRSYEQYQLQQQQYQQQHQYQHQHAATPQRYEPTTPGTHKSVKSPTKHTHDKDTQLMKALHTQILNNAHYETDSRTAARQTKHLPSPSPTVQSPQKRTSVSSRFSDPMSFLWKKKK